MEIVGNELKKWLDMANMAGNGWNWLDMLEMAGKSLKWLDC